MKAVLGVLAVLLAVGMCCGVAHSVADNNAVRESSTSTVLSVLVTPTPKPQPTSTASLGPVVLGGNIAAFTAKYGQPNGHSDTDYGQYHYGRYAGSTADALIVGTDVYDGSAYSLRVIDITYQPPSDSIDSGTSRTVCSAFAPSDASKRKTVTVLNTSGGIDGVDVVYYSARLAHELPADIFTDSGNNPVQSGLFDIRYFYADGNSNEVSSCRLLVGTEQDTY